MGNLNSRDRTRRVAVCAMLSALGVVMLYLGSMIEVVDISMAVIASLLCVFAVIEYGGAYPWLVFAVTSVISMLMLPNKTPAAMYVVFFGFYPILKEKLERKPKVISWIFKELIFNAALALMIVLVLFVFTMGEIKVETYLVVLLAVLAELMFVLYDIALTRLISLYLFRLRKSFIFKNKMCNGSSYIRKSI